MLKYCIGQTRRCVNDWLKAHEQNIACYRGGRLSVHCNDCSFSPLFANSCIISYHKDKCMREITEAKAIISEGPKCVSTPSISLMEKKNLLLTRQ